MLSQIMVDVETLSTHPNAVIIQIAAIKFEFSSDMTEQFIMNSSIKSSTDLGLHVDTSTIEWWKSQPTSTLKSVTTGAVPIQDVMSKFVEFVGNPKDIVFWCNGMNFDFPIIESTCRALNIKTPWRYYNLRDARTVYAICNLDWKNYPRIGSYHNGLDDCLTQIKALKECLS